MKRLLKLLKKQARQAAHQLRLLPSAEQQGLRYLF